MKIQWIPSFLSSPDDTSDYFAFDKNNRYIICKTKETDAVHFLIYDKMFNDYIKLTADPSNPKISTQYDCDSIWNFMQYFLPISLEQMLIVIQSGETSVLLLLVKFDLRQKTYKFLNYYGIITKCQQPEFVKDGEILGLFFKTSIDGEMVGLVDNETSFFVLLYITVEESLIKLGEKIRFNHKPYADFTYPIDLYLRNNKLWYIRRVDHDITFLPNIMGYSPPSVPPQNHNLRICYFNLEEKFPSEIFVDEIEIEEEKAKLILHWVQDSLVYLQRGTKFNVLNLLNLQWKSEALDCGIDFTDLDSDGKWQINGKWAEFQFSKNMDAYWARYSSIYIDNEFVVTAIDRKCSLLHQIPLKEPLKLSFLAWTCALNAGLIQQNTNLPPKLPYSRLF